MLQNPYILLTFEQVHNPLRLPGETTSEPPKVVRTCGAFNILTSKCALGHNGVHLFSWCFVYFDLETRFAPQRCALFRHRNFEKCSEREVLLPFSLANVLRATTECTFSTSQLPKVIRTWCALYILTSKCASRHNGVQFSISHLASWLRTRRFSEPTFRPSGLRSHKSLEIPVPRDFPTLSRTWASFFWLFLFSDLLSSTLLFSLTLPISAFHLSILSEVWLLNFLRQLQLQPHYIAQHYATLLILDCTTRHYTTTTTTLLYTTIR